MVRVIRGALLTATLIATAIFFVRIGSILHRAFPPASVFFHGFEPPHIVASPAVERKRSTSSSHQMPAVDPQLHGSVQQHAQPPPAQATANFHVVFSTGCSSGQEWQSFALFHSILMVDQPGDVTRVASGCTDEQLVALQATHQQTVATMSDRFHLHVTPNFSRVMKGKDYKFFNKPFGLRHWMQQSLGFPSATDNDDTIFIILDPDQIVIRPFLRDYTDEKELWHPQNQPPIHTVVTRGQPMAQVYGFGTGWMRKMNMTAIFNTTVDNWNTETVAKHYVAGPPYVGVGRDMYNIVNTWANIAVPVYQQTTDHLSEMWAYVTAAVRQKLPHQMLNSFMVSDVSSSRGEAWQWIDDANAARKGQQPIPHVIHYCQRYFLGPYFFSKYQLPKDFFTNCAHPLLAEPDARIERIYNSSYTLDGNFHTVPETLRPRMGYMLREITRRLNDAAVYYKERHCIPSTANYSRSFLFVRKKKKQAK